MLNIYLDHAASSPLHPEVLEAMLQYVDVYGNPSSQHSMGRAARALIEESRRTLADIFNLEPRGFIFTSGATEANNQVIRSAAMRAKEEGKLHLITSSIEHPSVYDVFKSLGEDFRVTYIDPGTKGYVDTKDILKVFTPDTGLISLAYVNNETGAVIPIDEISGLLHEHDVFFPTAAVQGIGRLPFIKRGIYPNSFTLTAHKLGGPKGIGAYYQLPKPSPIFRGGHQEQGARPGTENLLGIIGLAEAVKLAYTQRADNLVSLQAKRQLLLEELRQNKIEFEINEAASNHPGILNLWFKGQSAMKLLIRLDLLGISLSAGSACAAGSLEPSRVLVSLRGKNSPAVHESLRISFAAETSEDELRKFVHELAQIVKGSS